jgi:hypothetical protein
MDNICIRTALYGLCYLAYHGSFLGLAMLESAGNFNYYYECSSDGVVYDFLGYHINVNNKSD